MDKIYDTNLTFWWLFLLAGILWTVETIPQIIKTLKIKSSKEFSIPFLALSLTAFFLYGLCCLINHLWYLFVANLIPALFHTILFILIILYRGGKNDS